MFETFLSNYKELEYKEKYEMLLKAIHGNKGVMVYVRTV
jgi:hypothetical protein